MEFSCSCFIANANGTHPRACKSIISVGQSDPSIARVELKVCSARNTSGRSFVLTRESVICLQTHFIGSGRCTIQLKTPNANIFISEAPPVTLRHLVEIIEMVRRGESPSLNRAKDMKAKDFTMLQRSLRITRSSQYPAKCETFPLALKELIISGLSLKSVDPRWFELSSLTFLDLSNNLLGLFPKFEKEFSRISTLNKLRNLSLSCNHFKGFSPAFWLSLPRALLRLDLSCNSVKTISNRMTLLDELRELNLAQNRVTCLPEAIYKMSSLRILNLAGNNLYYSPASIRALRFDFVDFTGNPCFISRKRFSSDIIRPGSLIDMAAAVVLNYGLPWSILPWDLQMFAEDSLVVCCLCYKRTPKLMSSSKQCLLDLSSRSETVVRDSNGQGGRIPVLCWMCISCSHKKRHSSKVTR
ncbi:hypothetical protein AB6A40_001997 [Gnathostoma spinigerum]|uniref:PIF1/LRR1 pleckstrin homology domain-containing protein n=1 Tax=Gnathostoma spinigerum TaxID=75299 RepID=A0ABD6E5M4_9BILA